MNMDKRNIKIIEGNRKRNKVNFVEKETSFVQKMISKKIMPQFDLAEKTNSF